tara:strand:- start:8708 stop:9553 length:846 start_codon:yes stop_codon:yes gene_type:complete
MSEKISLYIPAYNAEKTIEFSINSILEQTVKIDEIIVVNDSSIDDTVQIVKKYSEIKIINNEKNFGLGFNRNKAILDSKNEIIANIDSDVVLEKNWAEILLDKLGQNKIGMCGGNMKEKLINNSFNMWRAKYYSQNWGNKDILNPPFLFGCNSMQYKSIWKEIGGYDEELFTNGEDINYSKKINASTNFNLFYSSDAMCYHLQDDNLNTLTKRVWRYHSFGYKIKKVSFFRFLKLSIKQLKFLFQRSIVNLFKLEFSYIFINFCVFIYFIKYEFKNYLKEK